MANRPAREPDELMELACACAAARQAARALTQLYDGFLRAHGIEAAQFALLSAVHARGPSSQAGLGRALGLDKTTLSRNLRVLARERWIEPVSPADGRERRFAVTDRGGRVLAAARPDWQRAQATLRSALKPAKWQEMQATLRLLSVAARKAARG